MENTPIGMQEDGLYVTDAKPLCFLHVSTLILLITTIVIFNLFYLSIKSLILGKKCVFKHQDLQMFGLKLKKESNFHPLEAGRIWVNNVNILLYAPKF